MKCSWTGLGGYVFAFLFFLLGFISLLLETIVVYRIGKAKGWFYTLSKNDIFKKNPFVFLSVSVIVLSFGGYFLLYKLLIIIYKYVKCLFL